MNKKTISIVLLILISCVLIGQDDFEAWKQKEQEALRQYKSKQDKAFVEFLEKNWEAFDAFKGEKRDETPKPQVAPVVSEAKKKTLKEEERIQESHQEKIQSDEVQTEVETTQIAVQENIVEKVIVPEVEEQEKHDSMIKVDRTIPTVDVTFWGLPITYNYQPSLTVELNPLNEKAVANFWYIASNTDFETLLKQLHASKEKMSLNDWGYCLLVNELGKKLSGGDDNVTRLFIWFILTKTGYECKVGFSQGKVFLLLPSANTIYGVSYVLIGEKRYYALSFDRKEKLDFAINTYEGNYPNADDLIDLSIKESPSINKTIVEKELKFKYAGTEYTIPVRYDQNAAEFFANYPQTNLDVYFNAPLSPEATQSLMMGLKPIIEGKTQTEAANILLRFVQTAFQYKTDGEQFGREKSFFSDETLFYPYCDCEDRSIIFSYLIRQILARQVVGLDYPGHIATGVNFAEKVPGDFIMVEGENYTICDPTYINADLGMAMPQFKNVEPKIIELSKN
jgi:hypothetical protein